VDGYRPEGRHGITRGAAAVPSREVVRRVRDVLDVYLDVDVRGAVEDDEVARGELRQLHGVEGVEVDAALGGSLPERKGLGGWLDEPLLLLGQDELVRLGDVQPVFHALMHDDDLATAVEEIVALDARRGQAEAHLRLLTFFPTHFRSPWAPTEWRVSSTRAATMR